MKKGGTAPAALNAANEVAVEAFLAERIGFLDIVAINEKTMNACQTHALKDLEVLAEADQEARRYASQLVSST
jgi:1-deoxy-D-xylulose-5-phosphate reductoisomerase